LTAVAVEDLVAVEGDSMVVDSMVVVEEEGLVVLEEEGLVVLEAASIMAVVVVVTIGKEIGTVRNAITATSLAEWSATAARRPGDPEVPQAEVVEDSEEVEEDRVDEEVGVVADTVKEGMAVVMVVKVDLMAVETKEDSVVAIKVDMEVVQTKVVQTKVDMEVVLQEVDTEDLLRAIKADTEHHQQRHKVHPKHS